MKVHTSLFLLLLGLCLFACEEESATVNTETTNAPIVDEEIVPEPPSYPTASKARLKQLESYLNRQFGERYEWVEATPEELFSLNYSPIWLEGVPEHIVSPAFTPQEPIGYIGKDFQRIYMHFSSIKQDPTEPHRYLVIGKSMVKRNICDFKGYLDIDAIRLFQLAYTEGEDYTIDPRKILHGIMGGTYRLEEDSSQRHVGIFQGRFTSTFMISGKQPMFGLAKYFSAAYRNHQFQGSWSEYGKETEKPCNWGIVRIPGSGGLDIGASEFSAAPAYRNKGWTDEPMGEWWK